MTTVMDGMQISSAEPESKDGLTTQQRRLLWKLVIAGEVVTTSGEQKDYQLATSLDFHPAISREVGESMARLVALHYVQEVPKMASPGTVSSYGDDRQPIIARPNGKIAYRPVLDAEKGIFISSQAVGHPVLARLYLYGPFDYGENRSDDGEVCYKSFIAESIGEPASRTDALRADVDVLTMNGLVNAYLEKRPAKWPGGHGQTHDLIETHVSLELA